MSRCVPEDHGVIGPRSFDPRRRLRARIDDHLASRDVARVIYGAIVGLALILALGRHPPSAGATAGLVAGTAIAVGLAELYSEVISKEASTRRPVTRADIWALLDEAAAVVLGAGFPTIFFIAAAIGLIELDTAFTLAKWSGLGRSAATRSSPPASRARASAARSCTWPSWAPSRAR